MYCGQKLGEDFARFLWPSHANNDGYDLEMSVSFS